LIACFLQVELVRVPKQTMENMVQLFELLAHLKQNGHNNAECEVSYLGPQSQMSTMIMVDKVRPTCPLRRGLGTTYVVRPTWYDLRGSTYVSLVSGPPRPLRTRATLSVYIRIVDLACPRFVRVSDTVRARTRGTCSISQQVVCAQEFKVYQAGPKADVVQYACTACV
jgi:hypothetical protein